MTSFDFMAAAGVVSPTRFDPLDLFLNADPIVQAVIAGLLLASVWVWTIIFSFSVKFGRLRRASVSFEQEYWTSDEPENLISRAKADNPSGHVAGAGIAEFRRSTKSGLKNPDAALGRVAQAMDGQVAVEADALAERLNFLATTGSVAPFIGLFGTVWGIMNSFFQIGMQQNSSLAVVAPGVSEALFATAVGLFAAIPAVIAYNRFSNKVNGFEAKLQRFADRVQSQISRELESR